MIELCDGCADRKHRSGGLGNIAFSADGIEGVSQRFLRNGMQQGLGSSNATAMRTAGAPSHGSGGPQEALHAWGPENASAPRPSPALNPPAEGLQK